MGGEGTRRSGPARGRSLIGALLSFLATVAVSLFGVLFWASSGRWVSPLDVVEWTPLVLAAVATCVSTLTTLGMLVRALAPREGAGLLPAAGAYLLIGVVFAAVTGAFGGEGLLGALRVLLLWPLALFLNLNLWIFGIEFPT